MSYPTKPGGGNKPEAYIPAGNGDKSGEYTDGSTAGKQSYKKYVSQPNCHIKNRINMFNPMKSKLVQTVNRVSVAHWGNKVPEKYKPNSVIKTIINGELVKERYYNNKGHPYLDIHYTNHGNPKAHPKVPHIHRIIFSNGKFEHQPWEEFK